MLKRLLPSIREKIPLKKKSQEIKQLQAQERNLSPNLLLPVETKNLIVKAGPKIAGTAKNLSMVTAVVFALFLVINLMLQGQLNKYSEERDTQIEENNKNSYIEEQVVTISKVTKLYKDTKLQNQNIADSLDYIYSVLNDLTRVEKLSFERDDLLFEVNTDTVKASSYARVINRILESEDVESIILNYVEYDRNSRTYEADFDIKIKWSNKNE